MSLDIQPKTSGDVITSADFNAIVSAVNANETAITGKQDALVSGTNIKTINGNSILGEGNIEIDGGNAPIQSISLNGDDVPPDENGNVALTLDKNDVGLDNVDNTSDLSKPISTATQTALNEKVDKVEGKGLSTNDFTDNDKTKLDSAYQKPQDGIPKTDLTEDVQGSLNNADTALQEEEALALLCPKAETTSTTITDAIPHNVIDYTIYGNTVDNQGVGDEVTIEGQTKYVIPVSVRGKNLLDSSLLINAENYTLNSWYSGYYKAIAIPVPNGTYVFSTKHLSGYVYSGAYMTVTTSISGDNRLPPNSIFEGAEVSLQYDRTILLTVDNGYIYISSGSKQTSRLEEFYSNVRVMLEKGSAGTDYEPYVAPQTVNIYLEDSLGEGQSISLVDTNVPIPLISRDTNIIEFGTSVQPSRVKIKYYQDINKVIAKTKAELQALILSYHS